MPAHRKIKREYHKPFFRSRRRGRRALPLLLSLLALLCAIIGFAALALLFRDDVAASVNELRGTPRPTATLPAQDYAMRGIRQAQAGRLDAASEDFALAAAQRPGDVDYLYEYGKILIELERSEEAAALGERAIAAAPADARGYALRARALMWEDPGAAIPLAVSGLQYSPDFAPLHAALAIAYTQSGRYAEGLQRGYRATELDPLDAFAHRAYSFPLIYTGRYDEAIGALEKAVGINPNLTAPYFELASVYSLRDYEEMAVGIYRRILELEPDNAKAYLRICQTYAEVGEFQAGTEFCEVATEINPEYAPAWQFLGQLQYSRRNYETAVDSLERCVDLGSTAVECYYIRGLAYYFLGDCQRSWDTLLQAFSFTRDEAVIDIINRGLRDIRFDCPGFENAQLPTPIPPTPIPPTPIGGI